jgi:hypothetical protein
LGRAIYQYRQCVQWLNHIHFKRHFSIFRAYDAPLCKMIMVNALMHHQRGRNHHFQSSNHHIPGMDYQIVKQLVRQGVIVPNSEIATKLANHELLTDSEAEVLRRAGLTALLHIMWMK